MSVRVEIGAGARAHDGFLAFDVNPRNADVVGDALHLPFRTASVEALRAVDVLEHISYRDTDRALAEWARVCAPDAEVYVQVPDAGTIMRWFAAGDDRLATWFEDGQRRACSTLHGATWRLLGGHEDGVVVKPGEDFRWNSHYSLYDAPRLYEQMERAGFTVRQIDANGHPNLLAWAIRAPVAA